MTDGTDKQNCESCSFWNEGRGECRRHAPIRSPSVHLLSPVWPATEPTDWCGDWEPLPGEGVKNRTVSGQRYSYRLSDGMNDIHLGFNTYLEMCDFLKAQGVVVPDQPIVVERSAQ